MGFENYKGSIKLAAGLIPAASGYPLMQISDIQADEAGTRLDVFLANRARIGEVTLLANSWTKHETLDNLFYQVVEIEGVTENTQVDLTPSVEQLAVFYGKDLAFVTENEEGVVTVYCIGQKPTSDYTIQVTMTEVVA